MVKFTDKKILDKSHVTAENIAFQFEEMFSYDSEASNLQNDIFLIAEKMVEQQIATGELDAYIGARGDGFKWSLIESIERDIGATIVATLIDANAISSDFWDIPLADIESGFKYSLSDDLSVEVNNIAEKIVNSLPEEIKNDETKRGKIKARLIDAITNEIGEKKSLLQTDIVYQAQIELSEKQPEEKLKSTIGDAEKHKKISNSIDSLIDAVVNNTHPALFNMLSEEQKQSIKEEMRKEIITSVCNEIWKSRDSLYNELSLGITNLKQFPLGIDFEPINNTLFTCASRIAEYTVTEEAEKMYEAKMEYYMEEGITVRPKDERQWDDFVCINRNKDCSPINIEHAIKNSINKVIHDFTDKMLSQPSIGDEVLNNNEYRQPLKSSQPTNEIQNDIPIDEDR